MNDLSTSAFEKWKERFGRVRLSVRRATPFASGVLAALLALLLYNSLFPGPHQITQSEVNDTVAQVMASATPPPPYSSLVYQAIQPSLVLIESKRQNEEGEDDTGLGSGVVIDDAGDILTSLHVVAEATEIQVIFADGTQSAAVIIATQPENDIAVIQGDEAYVVGNPFGLYSSMSAGVISGFGRSFRMPNSDQRLENLIQIDAAANPGNSGGPLLNRRGQVVGIVTAILNPTEDDFFVGIAFAVPITIAGTAAGLPPY
jgi:S1-C subfamily serine protease